MIRRNFAPDYAAFALKAGVIKQPPPPMGMGIGMGMGMGMGGSGSEPHLSEFLGHVIV